MRRAALWLCLLCSWGCGLVRLNCLDRQKRGTVAAISGELGPGQILIHQVAYGTEGSQNDVKISWAGQGTPGGPRISVDATKVNCTDFVPPGSGLCMQIGTRGGTLPPIHPDVTVFLGLTVPTAHPAVGGAFGGGGSTVRFEIEYAGTLGAATSTHPSAGSISANMMVQSRSPIHGFQFYGIGGFGLYGETFGGGVGSGEILAKNIGVGAKIGLTGQLRLRLDYRVFVLGNAPDAARGIVLQRHPQRVAVGLNFTF